MESSCPAETTALLTFGTTRRDIASRNRIQSFSLVHSSNISVLLFVKILSEFVLGSLDAEAGIYAAAFDLSGRFVLLDIEFSFVVLCETSFV